MLSLFHFKRRVDLNYDMKTLEAPSQSREEQSSAMSKPGQVVAIWAYIFDGLRTALLSRI